MSAQAALDELTALSTQILEAVLVAGGGVVGTIASVERTAELAAIGTDLLGTAEQVRADGGIVERVEILLDEGGVFVVRDGERVITATTIVEPTPGLVLHDLRAALRRAAAMLDERGSAGAGGAGG